MTTPAMTTMKLHRRRILRGTGIAVALPFLECVSRAMADGKESVPRRMLLISNNLGILPGPFFPTSAGTEYTLSPYLQDLVEFRDDFTVISGLSHPAVEGGHSTENCFLTGAKHPTSSGFRNSISVDQFAAEQLGRNTRFPTLNLGVNIDKANRSLAWTRDGVLLPAEDSPARLFQQLFLEGSKNDIDRRLQKLKRRGSILDALSDSTAQLGTRPGPGDRARLDQYFTSIRELEQRLHAAGEWEQRPRPKVDREAPTDITDRSLFFARTEQMLTMAMLALQTDSTRIVTLMLDAFATPVFQLDKEEKSSTGYHSLSHHGMRPAMLAQLDKADRQQMRLLKDALTRLADVTTSSGRLLDSTMVLYGSNMGDANRHTNTNLPILLAGGGFQHGRHLEFDRDRNTPLSNLFVSLLQRMGIGTESFSSSTGTLTGLESAS